MKRFLLCCIGVVFVTSCGSDTATNALSRAMGLVSTTSPTAASSSRRVTFKATQLFAGTPSNIKPLNEMKNDVSAALVADPSTQATALGNPLSFTASRAACFGPNWTDNTARISRPSGDLGIVYATASDTDVTACVGAQLNALVSGTPSLINQFVKLQAIFLATAAASATGLPAIGATPIDATSAMPTITGVTITSATLARLADDASGNEVYKTIFSLTSGSKTGTVTIYHTPLDTTNTNFKGLFQATLPQTSTSSVESHRGISMIYQQLDGVFSYTMKASANRSTDDTDFFGDDGQVDFTKTSFGEDGHWMIASFNETTNAATVHYAWQAGSGDGAVRAFGINIPAGTKGSLTGTGYFGFGAAMSAITATSTPWMTKMHCNWLNGASGSPSLTLAQRQTMTQNSSGVFIVDTSNINFAPTDSCNAANWEVTVADATFLVGARTTAANDLVTPPTATELPAVTVPTFTLPTR